MRIEQKIYENSIEKDSPFRIFDMIRATIKVSNSSQILEIINKIE